MKNKEMKLKLNKKKIKQNMRQFNLEVIKLRRPVFLSINLVPNEWLYSPLLTFLSQIVFFYVLMPFFFFSLTNFAKLFNFFFVLKRNSNH